MQEIIPQNTILRSETGLVALGQVICMEEDVVLAEDRGILFGDIGAISLVAAGNLYYNPTQIDPPGIQYSDAELRKEDTAQREAHNAEVFAAGYTAYACGVSLTLEGAQDMDKISAGDFSQSPALHSGT